MAQQGFSASINKWVAATKARTKAVRDEAAQRVVEVMQTPVGAGGNMPVKDGFLRASLVASTGSAPLLNREKPTEGVPYTYDAVQVNLVIVGADLSQVVTVGYTANYARPQEYGSNGREGRRFVALAAQQWQRIVSEVATEAKSRAGA